MTTNSLRIVILVQARGKASFLSEISIGKKDLCVNDKRKRLVYYSLCQEKEIGYALPKILV